MFFTLKQRQWSSNPTLVIFCAVASRIATVAIMLLANELLPTHNATGVHVFRPTMYPVPAAPGIGGPLAAFTRWDSAWFLSIADSGYPTPTRPGARGALDCAGTEQGWGGKEYRTSEAEPGGVVGSNCLRDVPLEEQAHAFFPLYPWLVRIGGDALLSKATFGRLGLGRAESLVLIAVLISNTCFVAAAVLLYHLGAVVTGDTRLALGGALAFCVTPASVFFSTAYAESLFSALSFAGLLLLFSDGRSRNHGMEEHGKRRRRGWCGAVQAWGAAMLLAAATLARSNGIAAAGVLVLEKLRWMADDASTLFVDAGHESTSSSQGTTTRPKAGQSKVLNLAYAGGYRWNTVLWLRLIASAIATGLQALLVVAPYMAVQVYAYRKFCEDDREDGGAVDATAAMLHPWCTWRIPSLYAHVQSAYWGVGVLRYFQWKQIPNFLLAAPVLTLTAFGVWHFFKMQFQGLEGKDPRTRMTRGAGREEWTWWRPAYLERVARIFFAPPGLPHPASQPFERSGAAALVLQWGFLGLLAAVCMNVQVSTRFLAAACPPLHWWTATLVFPAGAGDGGATATKFNGLVRTSLRWHVTLYTIVGAVLHAKFLPWT